MSKEKDDLEKLREIYLAPDIDPEDRADNEKRIAEWSRALTTNSALATWQQHDITQLIIKQAKDSYRDLAMQLVNNRTLTEAERASIWAKQDAMLWLLNLIDTNAKASLEQLEKEIKTAINVT